MAEFGHCADAYQAGYQVSQMILLGLDFLLVKVPVAPTSLPNTTMANPAPSLDDMAYANLPNQVCERIFALPALHTDASNCDRGIRL